MLLLMLSMPAFAQDYTTWDEPTWTAHLAQADADLQAELGALETWMNDLSALQVEVIAADSEDRMGQSQKDMCSAGKDSVDALYAGFTDWGNEYADSLQWTQNNDAVTEDVQSDATVALLTYIVLGPQVSETGMHLAGACMLVGISADDTEFASYYARYGMVTAEGAKELGLNVDETVMSAVTIADAYGLPETSEWVAFGRRSCESDECKALMDETGGDDSSDSGDLSTTLALGWRRPSDLHQLGVGLGVRYNNVRVEGDFLYGLQEKSRGWSVKAGLNKRFGGAWGGELGVLGVLDQYGVNDTTPTYALDRSWGLEVPLSLHFSVGSQAAIFGSIAPRWNQQATRRSADLPDWMHELHGQAGLRYHADLATLEASWFWWQSGAGKLTGPRVSLLF